MNTIDNYLKDIPKQQKAELESIRNFIKKTIPEVSETISYGIPTFKYKNKSLVHFAAFKDHLSLFPGSEPIKKLQKELKNYKVSKGTIQFTVKNPLPKDLIDNIITIRKDAIDKNEK